MIELMKRSYCDKCEYFSATTLKYSENRKNIYRVYCKDYEKCRKIEQKIIDTMRDSLEQL